MRSLRKITRLKPEFFSLSGLQAKTSQRLEAKSGEQILKNLTIQSRKFTFPTSMRPMNFLLGMVKYTRIMNSSKLALRSAMRDPSAKHQICTHATFLKLDEVQIQHRESRVCTAPSNDKAVLNKKFFDVPEAKVASDSRILDIFSSFL